MNPGTSLHFDGQALEEQQEAELKQEDLRREQELRELLTTALPDDLLDDDTASFSSHESSGSLSRRHDDPPSPSQDPWVHLRQQLPAHHNLLQQHQQQTSTPNGFSDLPPLKTPAPTPWQNGYGEHYGSEQHFAHPEANGYDAHDIQNGQQFIESSDDETLSQQYERGEVEGAASDEVPNQPRNSQTGHQFQGHGFVQSNMNRCGNQARFRDNENVQNHLHEAGNCHGNHLVTDDVTGYHNHGDHETTNGMNGYQDEEAANHEYANEDHIQNGDFENGGFEHRVPTYNRPIQEYGPSHAQMQQYSPNHHHVTGNNQHVMQHERNAPAQQTYVRDIRQNDVHTNQNNVAKHRVQYRGDGAIASNAHQKELPQQGSQPINGFPAVTSQTTVGFVQHGEGDQLQQQFLNADGDEATRQMAQLQILYKARGWELDRLGNQFQVLKEDSAREKRILNHQLALAQGEKAGATASYEQCQQLLVEAQQENSILKGQLQAAQAQIQALNAAKQEVEEKLQSTESAIDSLTSQLTELQRSQPLARAREQQDGLLKSLQERYEQELTRLKEKVDGSEAALEEKGNKVATLRHELSRVAKAADQAKLEQGNTINALTSQLQHSQKQCRELLETGSLQEINLLRVQLQEATAARDFSQDMTSALQEELSEMKEQLQMYESAMELGVMAAKSPESAQQSKSFAVRNLAKSDWSTPQSQGPSPDSKMTPDELIQGLRKELERSLQSNRTKRGQLAKLQGDLRASKMEMESVRKKLLESETTAKDKEVRFKVLEAQLEMTKSTSSAGSPASQSHTSPGSPVGHQQEEIDKLRTEKEDLAKTLEAVRAEESRLAEVNMELKKQMADMVTEWDQDKKIDLERVQKTCLQLQEDSSRHLREEMVREFQSERDMLKEAHQHQLQELRSELEQAQKELVEVKGLYVDVCEEKNGIEDAVTKTLKAEAAAQLETAKEAWQSHHDAILQELRESLESSHRAALVTAKNAWRQEAEEEKEKLIQEQVALAKAEWSEEVRKEAMKSALMAADAEWQAKLETELEERVKEAKRDLEASHEEQLARQREHLQADHEANKAQAIQTALASAKSEWTQSAEASTKEKIKRAIEMARQQWLEEDSDDRLKEAIAAARRQWTSEKVDWKKIKEEWMEKHGEEEITKRVAERTRSLESKHLSDITNLQGVLEKGRQRMKREMEAEKLVTLQEAKAQLEAEHKAVLAEALMAAKAEADKDKSESLEQLSNDWQVRLNEVVKSQQDSVTTAVQEALDQWHKEKQTMTEAQEQALASLQAEAEADQEELRCRYERELERGIEEAVRSAREQWAQNCDSELRKACDEILERKEQVWQQERADLQEQLRDTTTQLQESQRQAERHRKKYALTRQKLEKEIVALREQLQDADREMQQTEFSLRRELERLQSRLKGANAAAVEALEAKIAAMQRRHEVELEEARRERRGQETAADATTQTKNDGDSVSNEALHELKAHYIRTVKKIKVDVMQRMGDMRENCRRTVHTEVMKERHNTAKKLRRYYLQCLQQFLEDDTNKVGNDSTKAQSTASKLAAMAKALELPPDQLAVKYPSPITSNQVASASTRSRGGDSSPADNGSKDTNGNRRTVTEGGKRPAIKGKQQGLPPSSDPQRTSSQVSRTHDFLTLSDDKGTASHTSASLDSSGANRDTPLPDSSSVDSSANQISGSRSSVDLGTSSGTSWVELETGIPLSRLPIQPREFNPKPERLPSNRRGNPASNSPAKASSVSMGNVTVRSRESSPDNSARRIFGKEASGGSSSGRLDQKEPLNKLSLKSREDSPNCSPSELNSRGQSKIKDGSSGVAHKKTSGRPFMPDVVSGPSRESSPDTSESGSPGFKQLKTRNYPSTSKSSSNITLRSRRNEQQSAIGHDDSTSHHSPFMRPITDNKRSAEPRKGPVKVPPPTAETAAMLATIPTSVPKPVPQVTRHTQIPSPGPYKATDTSSASLDTVYNDLPASLGTIPDYPLDDPPSFALDKVVRFENTAQGSFPKRSKTDNKENSQTKHPSVSSLRKFNGASTLPSKTTFGTKGAGFRSHDKLAYMLQQDSGFVSPQMEDQISVQ